MYENISINDVFIQDAKNIIMNNKKKYDKYLELIEHHIVQYGMIVYIHEKYYYEIFTFDMEYVKLIANELQSIDSHIFIFVLYNYKYSAKIIIDGIPFAQFTYISENIKKNILEYKCKGKYHLYNCLGPELELINIFANLCNPYYILDWPNLLLKAEKMSNEINSFLQSRIDKIKLGSALIEELDSSVNIILLKQYINIDYHIIVGQYAIRFLSHSRLQIITSRDFMEEISELKELFKEEITYRISKLYIPTNMNLYKLFIYYKDKPIIDIYNAANFEIIPCIIYNNQYNIGNLFTLLRFRLIDLWTIIDKNELMIHRLIMDFTIFYSYFKKTLELKKYNRLFPVKYIGKYEDPYLNKARLAKRMKIKYIPPYIPSLNNE